MPECLFVLLVSFRLIGWWNEVGECTNSGRGGLEWLGVHKIGRSAEVTVLAFIGALRSTWCLKRECQRDIYMPLTPLLRPFRYVTQRDRVASKQHWRDEGFT